MATKKTNRWVAKVKTDSTHPPEGLFTKSAGVIARSLASKKVSPKGPVSGLRMLTYFLNRGGKGLSEERRAELEKAKTLLSKRVHRRSGCIVPPLRRWGDLLGGHRLFTPHFHKERDGGNRANADQGQAGCFPLAPVDSLCEQ